MALKIVRMTPEKKLKEGEICYNCKYDECWECVNLNRCGHSHWWKRNWKIIGQAFKEPLKAASIPRHASVGVREDGVGEAQSNLPVATHSSS
jgi:hypothetical protein